MYRRKQREGTSGKYSMIDGMVLKQRVSVSVRKRKKIRRRRRRRRRRRIQRIHQPTVSRSTPERKRRVSSERLVLYDEKRLQQEKNGINSPGKAFVMVSNHVPSFSYRLENFEILRRPQCSDTTTDSDNITIIADGAHTEESAVCLRKTLLEVFSNDEPIVFVLAMASDKNHSGYESIVRDTFDGWKWLPQKWTLPGKMCDRPAPEVIAENEHFKGVVVQDFPRL